MNLDREQFDQLFDDARNFLKITPDLLDKLQKELTEGLS